MVSGTSAIEVSRWLHQCPTPSPEAPRPWTRCLSVRNCMAASLRTR